MELLKTKDVAVKLKISVDHFRKVVKHQQEFPKPVLLTPKAHPMWRDDDIDNYVNEKAA